MYDGDGIVIAVVPEVSNDDADVDAVVLVSVVCDGDAVVVGIHIHVPEALHADVDAVTLVSVGSDGGTVVVAIIVPEVSDDDADVDAVILVSVVCGRAVDLIVGLRCNGAFPGALPSLFTKKLYIYIFLSKETKMKIFHIYLFDSLYAAN